MGRFVLGLILGMIIGILAMTINPNLPRDLRLALADVTALVMRSAEEAAEAVGDAADEVAREAEQATTPMRREAPAAAIEDGTPRTGAPPGDAAREP